MLISHSHKFIFIHIGKTGGTSIEKVLCQHLNIDFEETKNDSEGNNWKHIWAQHMRERVGEEIWDDYFTFAFVRNTYDMILSLYSMYTQYPQYTDPDQPEFYHPWNQYKNFEDFIISMDEHRHEPDEKWRKRLDSFEVETQMDVWTDLENLQTSYLTESWKGTDGPGTILVDFIGKYENLVDDFHHVCQTIGLPKLDLIHHGATKHKPYQDSYNERMKKVVYEHSTLDIERFGYSFASP